MSNRYDPQEPLPWQKSMQQLPRNLEQHFVSRGQETSEAAREQSAVVSAMVEGDLDRIIQRVYDQIEKAGHRGLVANIDIADHLTMSGRSLDNLDWAVGTSRWSRLSEHFLNCWLTGGPAAPPGHLLAMSRLEPRFIRAVELMIRENRVTPAVLLYQLKYWPDEFLVDITRALLKISDVLPRGYVMELLDGRAESGVRRVLRHEWPRIAQQAGIPGTVAHELRARAGLDRR